MGSLGIGIIALVLTVVFLLAFAVVAVNRWGEKISWLKHHGTPVVATVTSVESLQRRGIRWYYVTAQWQDPQTGTAYIFRSQGTPQALHYRKGESITVLIPSNPQRYSIELV